MVRCFGSAFSWAAISFLFLITEAAFDLRRVNFVVCKKIDLLMQRPFQVWEFEVADYQSLHLDSHFMIWSQHLGNRFQKFQTKQIQRNFDSLFETKSALARARMVHLPWTPAWQAWGVKAESARCGSFIWQNRHLGGRCAFLVCSTCWLNMDPADWKTPRVWNLTCKTVKALQYKLLSDEN